MNPTLFIKDQLIEHIKYGDLILYSTHRKLCLPIIFRLYRKMRGGIKFEPIKVVDGLIIDGHHRYVASILANANMDEVATIKPSASIRVKWTEVRFVREDWDTEAKIRMFNEQDAKYNGISISAIHSMLE